MAEVTRTTAKTYFNTGDVPTETQFSNVLDSIPFPGTDAVFTALSGTAWDGSYKTVTLTANTALTFSSTKRSGVLIVTQDATGGRTLSINGTSVPINAGANDKSIVSFLYNDVTSAYVFFCETDIVGISGGGGGDVTAPTLVSAAIDNAAPNTIVLTYDEALDEIASYTTSQWTPSGGRAVTFASSSGNQVTLVCDSDFTAGEVVTLDYAPGVSPVEDVAGNDAASLSGQAVTNGVTPVAEDLSFTGNVTETSAGNHIWKGTGADTGYTSLGMSAEVLAASADGYLQTKRTDTDAHSFFFGFFATNTPTAFNDMVAGFLLDSSGSLFKKDGTGASFPQVGSGGVIAIGNWARVKRTGSVYTLEKSTDGTNWTNVATLTYASTAVHYVGVFLRGGGTVGYLNEPKGFNLS